MASTEASPKNGDNGSKKLFTRAEVAETNTSKNTLIIIHNTVYDVAAFLNEHPGGEEVLLEQAGKDASEPFEDVGHSTDARQMMETYKIGEIVQEERIEANDKKNNTFTSKSSNNENSSGTWRSWMIPVALGILATIIYRYFISAQAK